MFEFQRLEVYKKAKRFYKATSKLLDNSRLNQFQNNQLKRAALSVPLNIAEGSGRFSKKDRANFFVIARASVFECVAIMDIAKDENLISKDRFENFQSAADELSRMLFTMIKNLRQL